MDRIERVITLLQAIVSTGDVADAMRRQIASAGVPLTSNSAFIAQVPSNIDRFIDGAVADATARILSSGGDLTTVGHVIGGAYLACLTSGLAVGMAASDQ